jgi:hypothetical protein
MDSSSPSPHEQFGSALSSPNKFAEPSEKGRSGDSRRTSPKAGGIDRVQLGYDIWMPINPHERSFLTGFR